jgi:hypothetical protein
LRENKRLWSIFSDQRINVIKSKNVLLGMKNTLHLFFSVASAEKVQVVVGTKNCRQTQTNPTSGILYNTPLVQLFADI